MTAPPTPQQRWYQHHHQAVTDQRNDIEVLHEQLAAAPNRDAIVMLCVAGQQSERPEYERARQAQRRPHRMGRGRRPHPLDGGELLGR